MQAETETDITTITEKGQLVIPRKVRERLGIRPRNRFLVYGEGDTVILKKIELPDVRAEWMKLKSLVDKKMAKYGEIGEEEINELVQKYRHGKKKR